MTEQKFENVRLVSDPVKAKEEAKEAFLDRLSGAGYDVESIRPQVERWYAHPHNPR